MKIPLIIRAPVYDTSGYAAHSRDIVNWLDSSGDFDICLQPTFWARNARLFSPDTEPYARMSKNAVDPGAAIFLQIGLPSEFERVGKYNVGMTTFEASRISAYWVQGCVKMDEIWVTSSLCAEAFRMSGVNLRIEVMSEGVDLNRFNPSIQPRDMDVPLSGFNFLVFGQWLPPQEHGKDRKNMGKTIEVFLDAFRDRDDVCMALVTFLNTPNAGEQEQLAKRVKQIRDLIGVGDLPRIVLMHGVMSESEVVSLYHDSRIKGLLSLSKGEGWWRPGAEASAAGLPVLCTGWGGQMDYILPEGATLFKYSIAPLSVYTPGVYHPNEMFWAEPDLGDVKNKLLHFVDHYDEAKAKAKIQQSAMSKWSLDVCVGRIAERLKEIYSQGEIKKDVPMNIVKPTVPTVTEL